MTKYNVTQQLPANGYTAIELFCGGGLGGVGFGAAGFDIMKAYDFDKNAIKSYRHNLDPYGTVAELADITTIDATKLAGVDVIFGGPPCQDFSVAGAGKGVEGDRGKLVWSYLEIIATARPKAFVFENVKGLIGAKHRDTFDELLKKFEAIGYTVSWQLINAWDYGVAQKRERVFIVGIRADIGVEYEFPQPQAGVQRTQTLADVIGDLPAPEHQDNGRYWTPASVYTYGQANRVQSFDKPSNTIPAHHNSGQPQHPTEAPRRFTIREALRIQSVPDWYSIPQDIALGAQYRIVGNGIATRVAYLIGASLAEQLGQASEDNGVVSVE